MPLPATALLLAAALAVPVLRTELPVFRQGLWRVTETHTLHRRTIRRRSTSCVDPTRELQATLTPMRFAMCSAAVVRKADAFETRTQCGSMRSVITFRPHGDTGYVKDIVGESGATAHIVGRRIGSCILLPPPSAATVQGPSAGL